MQITPLYDEHLALGARMVPFGAWTMPERYAGILQEHTATRTAAGLFDLSHMGEFEVNGKGAEALFRILLTNDCASLPTGHAMYSPMCNVDGGIVDDVILYKLNDDGPRYLLVVNASNIDQDRDWILSTIDELGLQHAVTFEDESARTALIAVQGPASTAILQPLTSEPLDALRGFHSLVTVIDNDIGALIARTGYTGEDGFELFVNNKDAVRLWRLLLQRGQDFGLRPVGLGARDTLRLEARMALYGNDIDATTTPLEAGLDRWVTLNERAFHGRDRLIAQRASGVAQTLVGLRLEGRAIPRSHYVVRSGGRDIGHVTSGTFAPTLEAGIALAYVETAFSAIGTPVSVRIREQDQPGVIVATPFYQRARQAIPAKFVATKGGL